MSKEAAINLRITESRNISQVTEIPKEKTEKEMIVPKMRVAILKRVESYDTGFIIRVRGVRCSEL